MTERATDPSLTPAERAADAEAVARAADTAQMMAGEWIRHRRRLLDMTQAELAKAVGLSRGQINRIEAGVHTPTPATRDALERALGGTPTDLDEMSLELSSLRVELEALQANVDRLEARVQDLEQQRLRATAERIIAARDDPERRDAMIEDALALAEKIAGFVSGTRERVDA